MEQKGQWIVSTEKLEYAKHENPTLNMDMVIVALF